jgi:purine nucleosidase
MRITPSPTHPLTDAPTRATWIDTDIGDDVDDAFALALATRLPNLQLVGVSTVAGPVERRAALARHLLAAAGRADVPVFAGSSTTLAGKQGSAKFSGPVAEQRTKNKEQSPILRSPFSVLRSPFSLLIALGPLTNIALALRADPTLAQRAQLVIMGGMFGLPYPDWNLRCDPLAAREVLASGMPITMVGMQLTLRTKLSPIRTQRLFAQQSDPLVTVLAKCVLAWRTWKRRMPYLHDALAVAIAADATLASYTQQYVRVGSFGIARVERHGPPNARVALTFDQARYDALLDTHLFGFAAHGQNLLSPLARLA